MNKIIRAFLVISLFFINGCRQMQVNEAKQQMQERLDASMGKTKDQIILDVGAPNEIAKIGSFEIFKYFQSYGSQSNAFANTIGNSGAYAAGKTWEAYDKFDIYFKNNVAVKWDGYVQR